MADTEELADESAQSMNAKQIELYERIQAFSLDKPDAQLPFSKRLARDNGWTLQYAQRAIEEYKKFAFLAFAAGHPVTPSDQVDQVWHLHLSYTHAYWDEFCSGVLQKPLHHGPTLGGDDESQKFDDWYRKTLESYEQLFDESPPVELWPAPEERFGRDLHFLRVNTQQNWILPKLQVQKVAIASVATLLALIFSSYYLSTSEGDINPLAVVLLTAMIVASGFGATRMIMGLVDFVKDPSRPRLKGDWSGYGVGSGCGGCSGCGGGCGGG